MSAYLVSYDIAEKDAFEYDGLWDKLKELSATRILYSEWIVSGRSANQIYEQLAPLIQEKDRLLVQGMTIEASWDNLMMSDDDFRWFFRRA